MRVVFANKQVIVFRDWEQTSERAGSFMESDLCQNVLRDQAAMSKRDRDRRKRKRMIMRESRRRNR